jgi:hypothetical protein
MDSDIAIELNQADCGDWRLFTRAKKMLQRLFQTVGDGLSALGGKAEIKAAYRFFENSKIAPETLLEPHRKATVERIKDYPVVGLVQDTTDLDYKHMSLVEGLGVLNDTKRPGCSLHGLIAFTPEKLCLGVVNAEFIKRAPEDLGRKLHNNLRPIEEKESYRWLKAYREACEVANQCPNTEIVVIGDRESDIYELFLEAAKDENRAELLVRGWHDRNIDADKQPNGDKPKLMSEVKKAPIKATIEFDISPSRGKPKRHVVQTVRAKTITLLPSNHKPGLPRVSINAVLLEEVNPPEGEKPIVWLLLTTLPIASETDIQHIVNLYLSRWGIELFFKTLKSGCKVEERQFKDSDTLLNCVAMFMIVAWRVMYVAYLGRACPDIPCTAIFEEDEWRVIYTIVKKTAPPKEPPTLGECLRMVAILGGHRDRKGDPPPGIIVMWRGLQQVYFLAQGWRACLDHVSRP